MEFQNIEELKKLRVVDLKERLSKLGKSTSGLKADLVDRLYNALAEKSGQVDLSAAAPSYVQMCNISSMEPEPPVVEVTIDTSQFDMSVQEPQIVTMGQYNVMDDVSQINVQHQINEQQVYYQSPDESDQLRLQQEDLWRQQQDQLLRQQQQQEAAERYQQQEFERQEMMERQELERITAAEEEAAAAAERMRVIEEQELEMNRVREVESDRERQAEAQRMIMEEEFRIQQQQREEEELMRRRYEEEQRQREFERQREVELARQRELEMEMERQRQTEELERQLQMEAERQRELERERLRELELERQREAELERQREAELARQREAELERQAREAELERQREAELERRAREAELERQREAELERQAREAELERQRQAELERQREAELERQREAEREAELERQKQAELRERQLMEMELERQREIELLRQREAERQKELELQRQKEAAEEEERQRELERQELERQELERKRVAAEKEEERLRELEREKALEKEKELERQRIAAEEEEERRKKEYQAELQKKKQEEEQMHQIYQEQLRKERDEQLKREEEFQRLQEFQKKEKELEEEELRQSLIDEARKNEVSEEKMEMDDDIQEIPRPPQDKDLIAHHSTSVITHTGNAQNFSHKISKQTSELEAINNSKNKENLDSTETSQNGKDEKTESPKEKLSKNQKRKIKKKRRQINRKEQSEKRNNMLNSEEEQNEKEKNTPSDVSVEIQYVGDEVDLKPTDPMYFHFMKIFENFKLVDPEQAKREAEEAALKAKLDAKKEPDLRKKPKDADEEPELEPKKDEQPKLSKRKLKQLTRLSIAELKQHVNRPDVVEMHDVTAKDPKLLVLLKSTRNTVPVPRHWCFKRKFLQGKRGIEKPPFNLPEFIKKTGIMEMRQALQEKEDQKTLKAKMREKVRPKMGKIDIDYQKLHDAFFKWQTKPRMTIHGDLYYEGKEYETRLKEKKPGELSDDLRTALGMPVGPGCQKIPPPWLIAMQRYGPPPSYPNLKVPGLNSPIPDGCSFGYHAGGWGKPPVDELGRPLYGDVFGTTGSEYTASMPEEEVDRSQWGELESESESEEEEGEEEEEEEGAEGEEIEMDKEGGIATPAEGGLATPSGLSSVSMGMETPDMIELRKRKIENEMDNAENPTLYQVLAEKKPDRMSGLMMGSTHVYDISSAMPPKVRTSVSHLGGDGGVDVALDPSELDMDQATMASRYEQTLREQRMGLEKEDLSDMVAEHTAKQKNKRKRATNTTGNTQPQDANRSAKKYKDFKF